MRQTLGWLGGIPLSVLAPPNDGRRSQPPSSEITRKLRFGKNVQQARKTHGELNVLSTMPPLLTWNPALPSPHAGSTDPVRGDSVLPCACRQLWMIAILIAGRGFMAETFDYVIVGAGS